MMDPTARGDIIAENIRIWQKKLGGASICAVTKTVPVEDINAAIAAGICAIGENRVQELMEKREFIAPGAQVHMIGRLQTNKVKYVVERADVVQSLDRDALAAELSKRAQAKGRVVRALVQVNIAREAQKAGVDPDDLFPFLAACAARPGIAIEGLMAIAPLADDPEAARPHFRAMRRLFEEVARANIPNVRMDTLSMGMSDDCLVAAQEGATMVRIGRGIFGARG
ncbi:MAG: YggS family pyridoxal phosphate-dependent enzyme [Christensenellales bacterium]|jgi:pyridoxal phosphate enzyme (YggS family)